MEKWLVEELEHKARMEQFDKDRKAHLSVKCQGDFDVPNPLEIRSLLIDQYDGSIDADVSVQMSKFANLESISFGSRYEGEILPEIVNTWLSILPKVRKFVSLLENDYGIGAENAKYAVHTWCLCYGKYVLDKPCDL